ncbi:MAG: Plug domain-containing protein [Proteobacteria bacterium]|nr:Plug domain-containing protein [Pseudomonadota bacterium]
MLVVSAAGPAVAEEKVIEFGDITVTSTTIDDRFQAKRAEPSNIAAVSGEEVDNAHVDNIQQLLQSIPGITTEFDSGESWKVHIRGVENQVYMGEKPGVAVVIDGVPDEPLAKINELVVSPSLNGANNSNDGLTIQRLLIPFLISNSVKKRETRRT